MSEEDTVHIYFVIPSKHDSEENCDEYMWEAYNASIQNEFQPQWIEEKKCRLMKPIKRDVFVMEEFEGEIFEELQTFKCTRIVGPRCLLSCFHAGEPIPDGPHPVFTTAMRGMMVCASGFSENVKEKIDRKVHYMGGRFTKTFRGSVTHLVTDSVWSVKYEKAILQKIPVLTERWVDAIWEANLQDFVKANDPRFDEYKCPVFMKLVITSTSLPKRQKEEVKKLINEHGGTFMGALDGTKVRIVLAPEICSNSNKLQYAKRNNIACLNVNWVYDSVSAGYSLPCSNYLSITTKSCSTPEKSDAPDATLNCSAISMIPPESRHMNNVVDETMTTTMSSNCTTNDVTANDRRSIAAPNTNLDRIDVREAKLAGPFLDGCTIYLAGFPANQRDKINRILNAGSATRLDDISDALTHVMVGDAGRAAGELKIMKSRGLNPYILGLDWLEESIKLKRPAPEENFVCDKKQNLIAKPAEPPSPLSKKNIQMLQRPKRPPVPQFDIDKAISPEKPDDWNEGEEEASLMKQYLQKATGDNYAAERSFQEFLQPHNRTPDTTAGSKIASDAVTSMDISRTIIHPTTEHPRDSADDSAVPLSQPTTLRFHGLKFLVTGFDQQETMILAESITGLGGQLVTNSFVGVPDFAVVPLTGASVKHAVDEIVTDLYIVDCVEHERVVELQSYHRPLSIATDVKPLADCVIATSNYTGIERAYLTKVAIALGAEYQDTFARKTNAQKGLVGSTHLLCPTPEGGKYNAAIKWSKPAVTSEWLLTCAAKMRLVSEVPYLVGEAIAPERPDDPAGNSSMGPPQSTPTHRNIITPKRHLPRVHGETTPGYDTPLINKRLSAVMSNTPPSPFHVATPETPYGQIFKPNPSPNTRKAWIKWVDNFPDMKVEEPPLKRRAPSTPLSELKRQFWAQVNDRGSPKVDDEVLQSRSSPSMRNSLHGASDAPMTIGAEQGKEASPVLEAPINRKLSFQDDNGSPAPKPQMELQLEQLEQVLQATSSNNENRYSLSGNAKNLYNIEDLEPIDKCMVKDSQPETVGWADPVHGPHHKSIVTPVSEEPEDTEQPRKRKFMLSGIKDRASYDAAIKNLGGEVSSEANFDPTATHLLCIKPFRNEKSLASIAAGKWVLHCSYLMRCEEEGRFVDEETFEWGNPLSKDVIPEPKGDTEISIAAAAHRWRLKLHNAPGGAFEDMVAMLLVHKDKYEQFERLITAGNGIVVQAKPPYDSSPHGKKITHCFVQPKQLDQPVDWAMLASKGILCFQPSYLSDYLTVEKPTNPRDSVIPEFKKYLSLLPK